jgi:hypothetical protein
MRSLAPVLLSGMMLGPVCAEADVYKCADDRRQPLYQDVPCPPGRELRNFARDPPSLSVIPIRPVPGTTTRVTAAAPVRPKNSRSSSRKNAEGGGNPAERRHIHPGMHEGEVMARIGAPDMKSGGGSRKLARWTYLPVAGDAQTLTTVVLDYGKVVEVERKVVR